ncbi:NAD(P)H-dependent oxidoreductase [Microbacterium sp. STN6]|uniref:NAD(P)H-dependent oxidoreductase n=1 Tax=Microbacterium sp. STN6 TaxID=2995588 RepID=UPI002260F448|nr:NAD(P)H-dependent oxidoreductase [Microbacterium sp. STN6]MCX7523470.1 NAD(P)H-dependent oxidoreductase [Microbacterium sp. STN6]
MTEHSKPLSVVAVSGTLHRPSKTGAVIDAVLERVAEATSADLEVIELLDLAGPLADALSGGEADAALADAYARVAGADLLVVATPVYKGSYTGLLKLFVDQLGQDSLAGTPVLLAAVGGSLQHALVIEHALRPLFGFFRADTVATGIYATGADFVDGVVGSGPLRETIAAAVAEGLGRVPAAG